MNQSVPEATVRAGDHPMAVLSAKRRTASSPLRSIQLRITPLLEDESWGWPLFIAAGEGIAWTDTGQSELESL
jgi:hypothetical protein